MTDRQSRTRRRVDSYRTFYILDYRYLSGPRNLKIALENRLVIGERAANKTAFSLRTIYRLT